MATADFLCGDGAAKTLSTLQTRDLGDDRTLPLLEELRTRYAPQQAGALLSLARLRQRAASKFPDADRLFFTQEALEQATAGPIARHHAAWLDRHAPSGPLLELGCGIGGDTLALARLRPLIAYELDPVRLRLAQANIAACGLADRVEFRCADWTLALAQGTLPAAAAAFADPSRRVDGRRIFRLGGMRPPLADLLALQARIPHLGVKVMPGVDDAEIPAGCGVEFVGHAGACKEAVLWFGTPAQTGRWASILAGDRWHMVRASGAAPPLGPIEPGMTLYEPHPALIRAGALSELCAELTAHLFDGQIAYLASSRRQRHPLAQAFIIDRVEPYRLKSLNRYLTEAGIGQVELKKRGFPVEPESLRPRLKLTQGGPSAVVFFTRRGAERIMLIGRRIPPAVDDAQAR